MVKSLRRPKKSRTFTYLFPYIKYNYGSAWAELFHSNRPVEAYLAFRGAVSDIIEEPFILVEFDNPMAAAKFREHPAFVELHHRPKRTIVTFRFEHEEAYANFLEGKYSKMYPKFIDDNIQYFRWKEKGMVNEQYIYQVCKRSHLRRAYISRFFNIPIDQIQECDEKPNIENELLKLA